MRHLRNHVVIGEAKMEFLFLHVAARGSQMLSLIAKLMRLHTGWSSVTRAMSPSLAL